jgi:hypothetical protein
VYRVGVGIADDLLGMYVNREVKWYVSKRPKHALPSYTT